MDIHSVTDEPCTCGALERSAAEPNDPVEFDEEMNEYHLTMLDRSGGYSVIYHCFFCGGRAPRSRRATFFATITRAETARLEHLTGPIRTIEEAVATLGPPAHDLPQGLGTHTPEAAGVPPKVTHYRTLTFTHLSDAADVVLVDYGDRGIRFTFQGKYLGKKRSEV